MNIVMFSNTYLPAVGGIENSIDIFSKAMRELGHSVLVVAPEYDDARESTDDILRVPAMRHFGGSAFSISLSLPDHLSERIEAFNPDIVHSHQPFLLGDSALRLARVNAWPIVYTNHTFMERYLHWLPVDWSILSSIAESLPVAYSNLVDHVITPTQSVADVLKTRGVTTALSAIPTGIDANFYASGARSHWRDRYNLDESQFVLGHLGRLNPEKNLDYLAEAALNFVQLEPQFRRFMLAGEGDSVETIQQLFSAAGLAENLLHIGLVQGRDCADAYAAMDAFIFTSLTDTQGLVLSEAMAAGNPVFALDAPGARDMITHRSDGLVLPQQCSAREFAESMDAAVRDKDKFAQLQANARESAKLVSIPACTEKMLALYEQVINDNEVERAALSSWDKLKNRWEVEKELAQQTIACLTGNTA